MGAEVMVTARAIKAFAVASEAVVREYARISVFVCVCVCVCVYLSVCGREREKEREWVSEFMSKRKDMGEKERSV